MTLTLDPTTNTLRPTLTARERLAEYVHAHGPIRAVRVSSAQARGAAKAYAYWGAVRYRIALNQRGQPSLRPEERASSDRRSIAGAERDAAKIAEREDRLDVDDWGPGALSEWQAESALVRLGVNT